MSNPQETAPGSDGAVDLSGDIARSIGSVWQRHAGAKPTSVTTEISKDTIKCMLEVPLATDEAVAATDEDVTDDFYEGSEVVRSPQSSRYRNEATAMISRLTGRRVLGFIAKRDAKTNLASHTFILERIRVKN